MRPLLTLSTKSKQLHRRRKLEVTGVDGSDEMKSLEWEYVIIVTTQRTSESKRYSCTIETTSRQGSTRAHTALFAFFSLL
jgi:hypothetical protein